MTIYHKTLADGRWGTLSFYEQMAHVGSEVGRALRWQEKKDEQRFTPAYERALELMDFTIDDARNRGRLRELCRVREALVDYFSGPNDSRSTPDSWNRYFLPFAYAARSSR